MNIILTGIPRSGTTLSCALLNKLPQCIALLEPMNQGECLRMELPDGYLRTIATFFKEQRVRLLSEGTAVSQARGGVIPDNTFSSTPISHGLRTPIITLQDVHFNKELKPDFRLVLKHPNMFTATLPILISHYPCYAVVRNPLAILLSWHTVKAAPNAGRVPFCEAYDATLRDRLRAEPDRINRQLLIMEWYFLRYTTHLPATHIIRYESLIATRGRCLDVIDPDAASLTEPLTNQNQNKIYDGRIVNQLAKHLLENDSIFAGIYTSVDIENLRLAWSAPI